MSKLLEGIIIGSVGGGSAGLIIWLVQSIRDKAIKKIECNRIYNWLKSNTTDEIGEEFRSTRDIASWNNLTEDRVRYLCSVSDQIFLNTDEKEDMWGVYGRESRSRYEDKNSEVHAF